jgi:SMC interacting uncharacterized protein involved in chromosome segregation
MKNNVDDDSYRVMSITDEMKEKNTKYTLNKFEYDFHREENNTVEKVIRVKRISIPNNGERWKIFEDNKVMFVLEGSKLNNKEKEYLRTVNGFNFLINQHKQGIKSLNVLKNELKKVLSNQA